MSNYSKKYTAEDIGNSAFQAMLEAGLPMDKYSPFTQPEAAVTPVLLFSKPPQRTPLLSVSPPDTSVTASKKPGSSI